MIPVLMLGLAASAPPAVPGYGLEFQYRGQTLRVSLTVQTTDGPLAGREAELIDGWRPSPDGSGLLDSLVPDGRLLRVEVVPPSPHSAPLTRGLFEALDRDGDRRLSRDELSAAETVLIARFDADGDGCLIPLEIVPDLLTTGGGKGESHAVRVRLVPAERTHSNLEATVGTAGRRSVRGGGLTIDFAATPARPDDRPATPNALLRPGREADRERFEGVAGAVATLAVRPQARGWFEVLDGNGDGQLSVRELRAAWDRLADDAAKREGVVRLPDAEADTISATLSPGTAVRPAVRFVKTPTAKSGPAWFQAMDRNGDGDVSRAEFLGGDGEFKGYDPDHDGLISAAEARAGDRQRRGERP